MTSSPDPRPVFCINCKHFNGNAIKADTTVGQWSNVQSFQAECIHPSNVSLVIGLPRKELCHIMRTQNYACGPWGAMFERKEEL